MQSLISASPSRAIHELVMYVTDFCITENIAIREMQTLLVLPV